MKIYKILSSILLVVLVSNFCNAKCSDLCSLPKDSGPCKGVFPSFYWNSIAKACRPFNYGGCEGNANRFERERECEAKCGLLLLERCELPQDSGPCKGTIPSFYWDNKAKICKTFLYGGCKGNPNRFEDEAACQDECGTEYVYP